MAAWHSDNGSNSTLADMSEESMLSEMDRSLLHVVTGEADPDSQEAFFAAIWDWNTTEVKRLVKRNNDLVNSTCPDSGDSPLHVASLMGHLEVVKILVEAGVAVNLKNSFGDYPLSCAVFDNNTDVIRYLNEHGANINATNDNGQTALHISVERGYEESVQELIKANCDPNIQDNRGDTALHYAIRINRPDLILVLMTSPTIDLDVKNARGDNAYQFANRMENDESSIQLIARRRPSLAVMQGDDPGVRRTRGNMSLDDSFRGAHVIKDADDELTFNGRIGKGGFGTVYRGKWRQTPVAIKKIPLGRNSSFDMFEKEVAVHKRAIHQNIVRLMAYYHRCDKAILVMELIEGNNLRDVIFEEGDPLNSGHKVRISSALLTALAFLHDSRILHLDIKPSNILIDVNKKPYICDLGLARLKSSNTSLYVSTGTPDCGIMGTLRYMAPENYEGARQTAACDVWSMAASLLEMFSGELFWSQIKTLYSLMKRLRRDDVFPETLSLLDDSVRDILTPCFEKDPKKRPTASDLLQKFERLDSF